MEQTGDTSEETYNEIDSFFKFNGIKSFSEVSIKLNLEDKDLINKMEFALNNAK